jgi:hypothetical protein
VIFHNMRGVRRRRCLVSRTLLHHADKGISRYDWEVVDGGCGLTDVRRREAERVWLQTELDRQSVVHV